MTKTKVMDRPMFKNMMLDPESVGILSLVAGEDFEEDGDEADVSMIMDRRSDSPEILMNTLRGDVRSIDARREELADMVGYNAAMQTPDEVLAMLQPVLAGGINALPGAMNQGPMPGGAPPGGPMGAPPAGPPMPPELMGAPPSAPMGAPPSAPMGAPPGAPMGAPPQGPMPGGPMPGGPMPGGPPPQGPMPMAKGGMIQRFKEGSDQDGVEPESVEPSGFVQALESLRGGMTAQQAAALYGADFVERARQAALRRMEPYPVPTFEKVLEEKIPLYQRLLGQDKNLTQAQMLFDIAKAGLAFAGNVDPRTGQPLRGSFAARLAGAASELPEKIGARASEAEKMAQQIKLLGIQAAEKEVSSARTEALAREKGLADFFGKLVPKTGTGANKPIVRDIGGETRVFDPSKGLDITNPTSWISIGKKPASGYTESDFNQFRTDYAPAILDGTATAEQKRLFLSAVSDYTQPRFVPTTKTEKNPTTGEIFLVQKIEQVPGKALDEIQRRAFNKLRSEIGKDFSSVFKQSAAITPDRAPPEAAATTTGGTAASTTGADRAPTTSGTATPVAPAATSTTAQGTKINPLFSQPAAQSTVNFKFGIQQTGLTPQQAMVSGSSMPNLMDVAYQGIGIISVPAAAVTRFPALGQFAGAEQQATSFIEQSIPIFKRALIDADKTTVTELTQKTENELDRLLPRAIANPTAYGRDLLSLDTALATREQLLKQKINNPDINIELKKSYRDRLADVQNARDLLGVKDTPRLTNIEEIESFKKSVPGKTPLYFYFLPDQKTIETLNKNDLQKIRENPFLRIRR